MANKTEAIKALKLVIESYEYAIETGEYRAKYTRAKTGSLWCPLCDIYRNNLSGACKKECPSYPCWDEEGNPNYIPLTDNVDKSNITFAKNRLAYLKEQLKKLEEQQ